jgi:glycosyltransferase involved in cell wall biosynthesis
MQISPARVPLVTVVVTVHRRLNFLRDALHSVFAQTFQDFEVIIADDSGASAARAIAAPFVDGGRVRYIANPETRGIARSLQGALEAARGRYAAILNDDDLWEPEFLGRLVPALEGDVRRILAFSDHWIMNDQGDLDREATDRNTAQYKRADLREGDLAAPDRFVLQHNGVPLAMAAIFRVSALDLRRLVPEVAGAYDFWISALLAATGGAFYYVPARLTRYRVHSSMETARRSPDKGACTMFILRSLIEQGSFPQLKDHLESRLATSTVAVGRDRLYFDHASEARNLFLAAFRLSPGWRPLAGAFLSVLPLPVRRAMGVSRA